MLSLITIAGAALAASASIVLPSAVRRDAALAKEKRLHILYEAQKAWVQGGCRGATPNDVDENGEIVYIESTI